MADTKHEDRGEAQIYEVGFHLVPSLSENDLALRVGELRTAIEGRGGTILSEEYPVFRDLAYTMRIMRAGKWEKYDSAYFGAIKFLAGPAEAASLKQELDQTEPIIRYLLIKVPKETAAPAPRIASIPPAPKDEKDILQPSQEGEADAEAPKVADEELDKRIDELVS